MNLNVCFHTEEEFEEAVNFVETDSEFYAEANKEWLMLVVEVTDQHDADSNEKGIEEELINEGIEGFHFEIED